MFTIINDLVGQGWRLKYTDFPGVWGKYTDVPLAEEACLPDAKSCLSACLMHFFPRAASACAGGELE